VNERFEQLWEASCKRLPTVVQEKRELFALFSLMREIGCESYLEIGTSNGGSLWVLAGVVDGTLTVVDICEAKSKALFDEAVAHTQAHAICGDSTDPATVERARGEYDVVMIDGGHSYEVVSADMKNYGPMARKMIVLHDINHRDVQKLWGEIAASIPSRCLMISTPQSTMGFGVIFKEPSGWLANGEHKQTLVTR